MVSKALVRLTERDTLCLDVVCVQSHIIMCGGTGAGRVGLWEVLRQRAGDGTITDNHVGRIHVCVCEWVSVCAYVCKYLNLCVCVCVCV